MAVGIIKQEKLKAINGIRLLSCSAGLRPKNRHDLSVIEICEHAAVAAIFTKNIFCAAPITLAKQHLSQRNAQQKSYLLINAGNANAGTGQSGLHAAKQSCELIAGQFSVAAQQVLPFSTGVIGQLLPIEKIEKVAKQFHQDSLQSDLWEDVADAILTTDTRRKAHSVELNFAGEKVTITGITKGSGMIKPNMATMLAYIACDAKIDQNLLNDMLMEAANQSFNCISVDGDTSTNDALVLIASGKSIEIVKGSVEYAQFQAALNKLCIDLAQEIVRDGEGATKFIAVNIQGGNSVEECREAAYTIAHSPLVKTAFFASDPNWGRILAALGRAPIENFDISKVDISLDEVSLINKGELASTYREELGQAVMKKEDIEININLGRGSARATVWTCDFSYDYVKINAEYRS